MANTVSINDIQKVGQNLWKYQGKYYRLFGTGITPNNCWIVNPSMLELTDISAATGRDIFGFDTLEFDGITGTVPAHNSFIKM